MDVEPPQPAITLAAKQSLFDHLVLYERVELDTVDQLLARSANTAQSWCLPRYRQCIADGLARVEYTKPQFGRAIVTGAVGLHNMQRRVRAALASAHFVDWDMANAHPTMLLQVCHARGLQCVALAHYVHHREECLGEVAAAYQVTREVAKDLYLRLIFLGGFKTWAQQHRLPPQTRMILLLEDFVQELGRLASAIFQANPAIVGFVRQRTQGQGNFTAAVLSTFLQEHECRVLEVLYEYCVTEGVIRDNVAVLCNDGFMLEARYSRPELAQCFHREVLQKLGFSLSFVIKPFDLSVEPEPSLGGGGGDQSVAFYLARLYPARQMWRMMYYGTTGAHRKMALVTGRGSGGKLSWWTDPERHITDWASFARQLAQRQPWQLHLDHLQCGAVLKEVVFDIDVTGFRRFCGCGATEKKICPTCSLHLEGAALVLRHLLVERLGVAERHLLWVQSGLKGFHCLVNDPRLMRATNPQRTQLLSLLECHNTAQLTDMARAFAEEDSDFLAQLEAHFERRCVIDRDVFALDAFQQQCLVMVGEVAPQLSELVRDRWATAHDGAARWHCLRQLQSLLGADLPPLTALVALQQYYPAVDQGPLAVGRHFYKAPFSVHAVTRAIALPVAVQRLTEQPLLLLADLCNASGASEHFRTGLALFGEWLDQARGT